MNPFRKLAQDLAQFAMDIRAKMNPALKKLEPLEQQEVSEPVRDLLRAVKWGIEDAERMAETFDGKIEKLNSMATEFEKTTGESAVAAAIADKKVIALDDHNNALTAAKDAATKEAKDAAEIEFTAKLNTIKVLSDRRKDAVTRLGEIAAATLTDEQLAGEAHEAAITAKEVRITKLKEHDILPANRPKLFSDLVAKADDASFESSLELILEAAGGKLAATAPGTLPPPPKAADAGGAGLGASSPDKKKVVC